MVEFETHPKSAVAMRDHANAVPRSFVTSVQADARVQSCSAVDRKSE